MEFLIKMVLFFLIVNIVAILRFIGFANLNKKNVIVALVALNITLVAGIVIYEKGIEKIDKSLLITAGVVGIIVLFFIFYKNIDNKK